MSANPRSHAPNGESRRKTTTTTNRTIDSTANEDKLYSVAVVRTAIANWTTLSTSHPVNRPKISRHETSAQYNEIVQCNLDEFVVVVFQQATPHQMARNVFVCLETNSMPASPRRNL